MSEVHSSKTRVGIVGTGLMAKERLRAFGGFDRVSVVGVCSRYLAKAANLCGSVAGCPYEDYDKMLSECDAVVLCVPNNMHFALASKALSAGKHVLIEYPLATNMEDAQSLQNLSVEKGCVLMVGNTIIHEAMFDYLRRNVGRLGHIVSAASRLAFYSPDIAKSWYMDRTQTGPIFSTFHYHHIEYYRSLLGEVEWVVGRDESIRSETLPEYYGISGGTLLMGHADRRTSCIQWYLSASGNGLPRGMWVNGTESSVTIISKAAGRSEVVWDDGGDGKIEVYEDDWGVTGSCKDFLEAVEGRLDHRIRLASDLETLKIGLLASSGESVELHHR